MTIFFAQALAEYAAMATVAQSITHLSVRLGDAIGEWKMEAFIAVIVLAFLWRIVTAVR